MAKQGKRRRKSAAKPRRDADVEVWIVLHLGEALEELGGVRSSDAAEYQAIRTVADKLKNLGPRLVRPHSGNVQGYPDLRELRPRAGNSPWRVIYRRFGNLMIIGGVAHKSSFEADAQRAARRLDRIRV
jgi:hypothetical protein